MICLGWLSLLYLTGSSTVCVLMGGPWPSLGERVAVESPDPLAAGVLLNGRLAVLQARTLTWFVIWVEALF